MLSKGQTMDKELARSLFYYDDNTGDLYWQERPVTMFKTKHSQNSWNTKYKNTKIKTIDGKGYLCANVQGKRYLAHRIIWLYVYGEWPNIIDHKNGIKTDNKISNLRNVDSHQNHLNVKKSCKNTSGTTGVYYNKKRGLWCAQIKFKGKTTHLGSSKNKEEVIKIRLGAQEKLGFTKRHGK